MNSADGEASRDDQRKRKRKNGKKEKNKKSKEKKRRMYGSDSSSDEELFADSPNIGKERDAAIKRDAAMVRGSGLEDQSHEESDEESDEELSADSPNIDAAIERFRDFEETWAALHAPKHNSIIYYKETDYTLNTFLLKLHSCWTNTSEALQMMKTLFDCMPLQYLSIFEPVLDPKLARTTDYTEAAHLLEGKDYVSGGVDRILFEGVDGRTKQKVADLKKRSQDQERQQEVARRRHSRRGTERQARLWNTTCICASSTACAGRAQD